MEENLFKSIVKKIEYDALHSTNDNYVTIQEQDDNHITIFDALTGEINSATYTIYNPTIINRKYVEKRILFSDDALQKSSLYPICPEAIIDYISNKVDKHMLLTIEKFVFITDEEEEDDSIYLDKSIENGLIAGHSFPDENTIGIYWIDENIVLVNIKAVQDNAIFALQQLNITNETEYKKETSIGIITTLLHEIRHAAQINSYLPEDILNPISDDDEIDAEEYARTWFEKHPMYVLKE